MRGYWWINSYLVANILFCLLCVNHQYFIINISSRTMLLCYSYMQRYSMNHGLIIQPSGCSVNVVFIHHIISSVRRDMLFAVI